MIFLIKDTHLNKEAAKNLALEKESIQSFLLRAFEKEPKASRVILLDLDTSEATDDFYEHSSTPSLLAEDLIEAGLPDSVTTIDIITNDHKNRLPYYAQQLSKQLKDRLGRDILVRTITAIRANSSLVSFDPDKKQWLVIGVMNSAKDETRVKIEAAAESKAGAGAGESFFGAGPLSKAKETFTAFEGTSLEPWLAQNAELGSPKLTDEHHMKMR